MKITLASVVEVFNENPNKWNNEECTSRNHIQSDIYLFV